MQKHVAQATPYKAFQSPSHIQTHDILKDDPVMQLSNQSLPWDFMFPRNTLTLVCGYHFKPLCSLWKKQRGEQNQEKKKDKFDDIGKTLHLTYSQFHSNSDFLINIAKQPLRHRFAEVDFPTCKLQGMSHLGTISSRKQELNSPVLEKANATSQRH